MILGAVAALTVASPLPAQIVGSEADARLEQAELLTEYAYQLARLSGDYRTASVPPYHGLLGPGR